MPANLTENVPHAEEIEMKSGIRTGIFSAIAGLLLTAFLVLILPQKGKAIPAFSRQYGTSCTTCHVDFPKLNDFGRAFKDAGFKFPKDDETFLKIPQVMLGSPAQKELWPKTVWPGSIPGLPPIGLRMNNFFQVVGKNRGNFDPLTVTNGIPQFVPRTDFETGFFSIFTAGNFGSDIAFWVDDDISIAGSNANGGLGDGYLRFVNLGRFLKLPKDSLSLRAGQFELDLPFTQARSFNLTGYDIYGQANIGATNSINQQNVNNQFAITDAGKGVELSGGHSYGGYQYSIAIVDQNTSGNVPTISSFVPDATGTGFLSDSNFKDIYARLSYRFNLERDKASRNDVQAAGPMGPRDHTSLKLGSYYFYGRSVQRFVGATSVLTAREPFYRVGGDFSFNHRTLNIYGLYMYAHDHNLLPVDATGTLITLPISDTSPAIAGFVKGSPAKFSGGFVQADYLALPWLMTIMRWDRVQSGADRANNSGAVFDLTRDRFTPGVQFLIHSNIKASFEYQYRPRQAAVLVTDPVTGLTHAIDPFRTNAATVGLEFVY
jgi:hypothetical protein